MSLTVTEANAVFALWRWLADKHTDYIGPKITEVDAVESMELLAAAAGRRLHVSPDAKLPALIVERLRAADSDGAAQALARAIDRAQQSDGRELAHRSIGLALETWRWAQAPAPPVAR